MGLSSVEINHQPIRPPIRVHQLPEAAEDAHFPKCPSFFPTYRTDLRSPQLAIEVANGDVPASGWHTCADSRTQCRIRHKSWIFLRIRLGDNGCGSLPDWHVPRLADGGNFFCLGRQQFLERITYYSLLLRLTFHLKLSSHWAPRKVGYVLFLGCGRV